MLVGGAPAGGKSILARSLASELRLPQMTVPSTYTALRRGNDAPGHVVDDWRIWAMRVSAPLKQVSLMSALEQSTTRVELLILSLVAAGLAPTAACRTATN